ncbi:MAG: NAD-dependent epimerase/dehydratase family protein [Alphaproteobacteria bacterium]|nr:NAD-dependent epimerase/dehydratase family protein [Alphaproteobacteria bacterium]
MRTQDTLLSFGGARLAAQFADRRVLITGAGGTIGAALSHALARDSACRLWLLDHFDHHLLDCLESTRKFRAERGLPQDAVEDVLCDIRDRARLDAWMARIRPDLVIHAAALKHVHLGERHPAECVSANLLGVRNVLAAAAAHGASNFMLISTDKAAAPVCVMGATKRLAELYLEGVGRAPGAPGQERRIAVSAVRFANVLGSQGSVVPRFAAQIAANGPIEITDPNMERYFMTAEEAVDFTIAAAALAAPSDSRAGIYLREAGEPTRIVDLADRMIAESGRAIEKVVTGRRPGEKLGEQLSDEHEHRIPTALDGVWRLRPRADSAWLTDQDLDDLERLVVRTEDALVRQRVFDLLDEKLARETRTSA